MPLFCLISYKIDQIGAFIVAKSANLVKLKMQVKSVNRWY